MSSFYSIIFKIKDVDLTEKLIGEVLENLSKVEDKIVASKYGPEFWRTSYEIRKGDYEDYTFRLGFRVKKEYSYIPPGSAFIELSIDEYGFSNFIIDLEEKMGLSEEEAKNVIQKRIDHFIRDSEIIYDTVHPEFGFGDHDSTLDEYMWDFEDCITWLNFLGPELVGKYGRDKLLSAPAWKIEELKDGGIQLITRNFLYSGLSDPIDENAMVRWGRVARHLGFGEKVIKDLRESTWTEEHKKELIDAIMGVGKK